MFPSNPTVWVSKVRNISMFALATKKCLYIGKMLPKREIGHELNTLPTIRHSNLLIHFIIFKSLFKLCNIFSVYVYVCVYALFVTYIERTVKTDKKNRFAKYEISWYSCEYVCTNVPCLRRQSSWVILILTVVVAIIIIIITAVMLVSAVMVKRNSMWFVYVKMEIAQTYIWI